MFLNYCFRLWSIKGSEVEVHPLLDCYKTGVKDRAIGNSLLS